MRRNKKVEETSENVFLLTKNVGEHFHNVFARFPYVDAASKNVAEGNKNVIGMVKNVFYCFDKVFEGSINVAEVFKNVFLGVFYERLNAIMDKKWTANIIGTTYNDYQGIEKVMTRFLSFDVTRRMNSAIPWRHN